MIRRHAETIGNVVEVGWLACSFCTERCLLAIQVFKGATYDLHAPNHLYHFSQIR